MQFQSRDIRLKDGRTCTLTPAVPEFSAELIEYMKNICAETPYLLRYPDEVTFSLEEEEAIIAGILNDPCAVMMTAVVDGKIAGNCSISGARQKRKIGHRCSLAIALYKEYWNLGIGSAMIGCLSELAGQIGYTQMDLEVAADNTRAQALYKKCGFAESGRRHHGLKFDDGSYCDEILMYREL